MVKRLVWGVVVVLAIGVAVGDVVQAEEAPSQKKTQMVLPGARVTASEQKSAAKAAPSALPPAESIPGSVPNILKRLNELDARLDQLSARLTMFERDQAAVRNDYYAFKEKARGPSCSADGLQSSNPLTGAVEKCVPFLCHEVTGVCRTGCSATAECAPGYVCNQTQGDGQCLTPQVQSSEE